MGFKEDDRGKMICVFDPFVRLRVHSWFKFIRLPLFTPFPA